MTLPETEGGATRSHIQSLLIVALLAMVVYLPCLRNKFVYDDYLIIVKNPNLFTLDFWKAIPSADYFLMSGEASYRPLASLFYYVIAMLCGSNPFAFHLASILMHACVTALVLLLGRRAGMGRAAIWLAAAFAVHPMLSEAVCSINYAEDLLVTLFVLLAVLWASHRTMPFQWRVGLVALATALACFSKESGVMALPLIGLSLAAWGIAPLTRKQACILLGVTGSVVLGFVLIRFGFLPGLPQAVRRIGDGPVEVAANAALIVMRYIGRMVFPRTLLADRIPDLVIWPTWDWRLWTAIAGHFCLLGIAVAAWRGARVISFGILWFYLCIAPTSNLMAMSCPEADRYLYLSGIGLLIAGIEGGRRIAGRWPASARGIYLGFACLLFLWLARTQMRIPQWYDNATLWAHEAAGNTANDRAFAELAVEANARGLHDDALRRAEQALEINSSNALARLQGAKAYHATGRHDRALNFYEAAISSETLHPHLQSDAWLSYGMLLEDALARTNDAAEAYSRALQYAFSATAANRLGVILAAQGRLTDAIRIWREALILAPEDSRLKANLAIAEQEAGTAD